MHLPIPAYSIISIAALILCLIFWYTSKNSTYLVSTYLVYVLFLLVCISFENIIAPFYSELYGPNVILYNYYANIQLFAYAGFYIAYLQKYNPSTSRVLYISLAIVFILVLSILLLSKETHTQIILPAYFTSYGYLILLIILTLRTILKTNAKLLMQKEFYLAIGNLVFFVCTFPVLTFLNELVTATNASKVYHDILNVGNILVSCSYIAVIVCLKTTTSYIKSL